MNRDQWKLICVLDKESGTWCVYPESIPGLVCQVDKLEDAPKELSKLFEVMLKYGFEKGVHEKYEL
jgi:hypothetical protein